jgi:hypothetical protein
VAFLVRWRLNQNQPKTKVMTDEAIATPPFVEEAAPVYPEPLLSLESESEAPTRPQPFIITAPEPSWY